MDDGKWHRLRILRKRRIGILQVDKTKPSRGKSEAGASILNTDGKVWIGKYISKNNFFLQKMKMDKEFFNVKIPSLFLQEGNIHYHLDYLLNITMDT